MVYVLNTPHIFPTQLSPTGDFLWYNWFGGTALVADSFDLAVAPAGWSVGITNFRDGTLQFGNQVVSAAIPNRYYLGLYKQDASGNVLWVKTWAGVYALAVTVDPSSGEFVVGGAFGGSVQFGSTTLTAVGSGDNFVVKFDSQGNVLWASSFGGAGNDQVDIHSLAFDYFGSVYATGTVYAGILVLMVSMEFRGVETQAVVDLS